MNSEKIIIILLSITGIVDTINGFTINYYPDSIISVGQVFRAIFILILLWLIIKDLRRNSTYWTLMKRKSYSVHKRLTDIWINDRYLLLLVLIIIYFVVDTAVIFIFYKSLTVLIKDLITVSKLLLPMLIIVVVSRLYRHGEIGINAIDKVLHFNMIYIPTSLIVLRIFDMGFHSYITGYGFKGFYNSNNELSIVMSILFIFAWEDLFKHRNSGKLKDLLFDVFMLFFVMIPFLLIGAKTSFIVVVTVSVIYLYRIFKKNIINLKSITKFLIIFFILFLVSAGLVSKEILQLIKQQQYFSFNKSFMSYIFSSRDLYLENLINKLKPDFNLWSTLFGFRGSIIADGSSFITVELDTFDLLINYGIIGTLLVYYYYLSILFKEINHLDKELFPYKLSCVIVLAFSTFAGHVMFGAFAGTFLAIVFIPIAMKVVSSQAKIVEGRQ